MKKCLYINHDSQAHHDYMLGIVLRENNYNWFYEKFINLCALEGVELLIEFTDIREAAYQKFLQNTAVLPLSDFSCENRERLLFFIKEKIEKNSYTGIWVDEYYIPGTSKYNEEHYVHTILIYGYDDDAGTFSALHFNPEKGVIKIEAEYDVLCTAFFNIVNCYRNGGGEGTLKESVICFKYTPSAVYSSFNINSFLYQFHDYLFSKYKNEDITAGIDVYRRFIYDLEKGTYIPYRSLHTLALHKKYMLDRLNYINETFTFLSKGNGGDLFVSYIKEYSGIVKIIDSIRALNLRQNIKAKQKYSAVISTDEGFRIKLAQTLDEAYKSEKKILFLIYIHLKNISGYKNKSNLIPADEGDYSFGIMGDTVNVALLNEEANISAIEITDISDNFIYCPPGVFNFADGNESFLEDSQVRGRKIMFKNNKIKKFTYRESNSSADISRLKFNIYKTPENLEWDFSVQNNDWHPAHEITNVKYDGQALVCDIVGDDPYIIANNIALNAAKAKYVYLEIMTTCDSRNMQLFFTTEENRDATEEASSVITVSPSAGPDGENVYKTYVFDMSGNKYWRGTINYIRLDIAHYDTAKKSGVCHIRRISITGESPVYNSKNDFDCVQGCMGWNSYCHDMGTSYHELSWDSMNKVWRGGNDSSPLRNLIIGDSEQTSCCNYASVRTWTAPAQGTYKFGVVYGVLTEGRKCRLYIKSDGEELYTVNNTQHEVEFEKYIKRGERIHFMFYNSDQFTVERACLTINIKKISEGRENE